MEHGSGAFATACESDDNESHKKDHDNITPGTVSCFGPDSGDEGDVPSVAMQENHATNHARCVKMSKAGQKA
jgi:hypothetical protein